jgi:hypothetical protein
VRLHGLREIAIGLGLLRAPDPSPWMWARVGGDVLDAATLSYGLCDGDRAMLRATGGLAAVAGIAALDVGCARALWQPQPAEARDYSGRSGLAQSPEQMRGKAREDFETPRDFVHADRAAALPAALSGGAARRPLGTGGAHSPIFTCAAPALHRSRRASSPTLAS